MFNDPLSINVNGVATNMVRTGLSSNAGTFRTADGNRTLTISRQEGKRNRYSVRLDLSKVASDPLLAGINVKASMSAYLVIDVPQTGFTDLEASDAVASVVEFLRGSDGAFTSTKRVLADEI